MDRNNSITIGHVCECIAIAKKDELTDWVVRSTTPDTNRVVVGNEKKVIRLDRNAYTGTSNNGYTNETVFLGSGYTYKEDSTAVTLYYFDAGLPDGSAHPLDGKSKNHG